MFHEIEYHTGSVFYDTVIAPPLSGGRNLPISHPCLRPSKSTILSHPQHHFPIRPSPSTYPPSELLVLVHLTTTTTTSPFTNLLLSHRSPLTNPLHANQTKFIMSDQPYDPYIPSGGAPGGSQGQPGGPGNQRTAAIQAVGFPFSFTYLVISSTGRTEWFLAPLAL